MLDRRSFCRVMGWLVAVNIVGPIFAKDAPEQDPLTTSVRRAAVESSSIASIGFRADLQVLEIEFQSGALYRYFGVPALVGEGFQTAESKGRYFSQRIRGRYPFRRLINPKRRHDQGRN
jgi:hypothetical protein